METRSERKRRCVLAHCPLLRLPGGRVRNWKRRWFVITDGWLFYFESQTVRNRSEGDRENYLPFVSKDIDIPRGVIPLVDVGVREIDEDRTKQSCFELFPLTGDKVKASKPAPGDLAKWIDGERFDCSTERKKSIERCFRSSHRLSHVGRVGRRSKGLDPGAENRKSKSTAESAMNRRHCRVSPPSIWCCNDENESSFHKIVSGRTESRQASELFSLSLSLFFSLFG